MRVRILGACAAAALVIGFVGAAPTLAASPSQQQCEAAGGTFTKNATCTTNVGNSPNSQTVDSSGQGNLNNKTTCSGPGNSTSGCP